MQEKKKKITPSQVLQYAINHLKAKHGLADVVNGAGVTVNESDLALEYAIYPEKDQDLDDPYDNKTEDSEKEKTINLFIRPQAKFYHLIAVIEAKLSGKYKYRNIGYPIVMAADSLITSMKLEGEKNFDELLKEVESYVLANLATLDDAVISVAPEVLFLPLPKSVDEYYEHFKVNAQALGKKIPADLRSSLLERFEDLLVHLIIHNFSNEEVNTTFLMRGDKYFFDAILHKVLNTLPSKLEKDFVTKESRSLLMQRLGDALANYAFYLSTNLHVVLEVCENAGLLDEMFAKVIDLFGKITIDQLKDEDCLRRAKIVSRYLSEHGRRLELFECLGSKEEGGVDIMLVLIKLDVLHAYQLTPRELSFIAKKLDKVALEEDFKDKYYDTNPKFFTAFIKHIEAFIEINDDKSYGNLVNAVAKIKPELNLRLEIAKAKLEAIEDLAKQEAEEARAKLEAEKSLAKRAAEEIVTSLSSDLKVTSLLGLGFCAYSFYPSAHVSPSLMVGSVGALSFAYLSKEKNSLLCATTALVAIVFGWESKPLAASACVINLVIHSKDIYNYLVSKPQGEGAER